MNDDKLNSIMPLSTAERERLGYLRSLEMTAKALHAIGIPHIMEPSLELEMNLLELKEFGLILPE